MPKAGIRICPPLALFIPSTSLPTKRQQLEMYRSLILLCFVKMDTRRPDSFVKLFLSAAYYLQQGSQSKRHAIYKVVIISGIKKISTIPQFALINCLSAKKLV
jgi:hypothetical protein